MLIELSVAMSCEFSSARLNCSEGVSQKRLFVCSEDEEFKTCWAAFYLANLVWFCVFSKSSNKLLIFTGKITGIVQGIVSCQVEVGAHKVLLWPYNFTNRLIQGAPE